MVNTNWLPPAVAVLGEIEVIDGATGQRQDITVASALTSKHKTDDLAAFAIGIHPWPIASDERCAAKLTVIPEDGGISGTSQPAAREPDYTPDL